MLNSDQISQHVEKLRDGSLSFGDFEGWFREDSRDVHLWGDERINDFVFEIEDVFSRYHFEHLQESAAKEELAVALRPFLQSVVLPEWSEVPPHRTKQFARGTATNSVELPWVSSTTRRSAVAVAEPL